ncbi:MAG: PAS domain-containing protein, partial [Candidatus Sericytochromatia bacterium]
MELRKSSLIGKSENISLITNKDFKIEWVNDHFELKTGYSFEQIKGKDPLDLIASENNDKKIIDKIRESIKQNKPVTSEILYKNHEDKQIWIKVNIRPVF